MHPGVIHVGPAIVTTRPRQDTTLRRYASSHDSRNLFAPTRYLRGFVATGDSPFPKTSMRHLQATRDYASTLVALSIYKDATPSAVWGDHVVVPESVRLAVPYPYKTHPPPNRGHRSLKDSVPWLRTC